MLWQLCCRCIFVVLICLRDAQNLKKCLSLIKVTDEFSFPKKKKRLKTFLQLWRRTVVVLLCLCPRACLISLIIEQPSSVLIGSKSLKTANSWHKAALNIKCRGGRCGSWRYMIRLQPSDKLQNIAAQAKRVSSDATTNFHVPTIKPYVKLLFFPHNFKSAHVYLEIPGRKLGCFSSGGNRVFQLQYGSIQDLFVRMVAQQWPSGLSQPSSAMSSKSSGKYRGAAFSQTQLWFETSVLSAGVPPFSAKGTCVVACCVRAAVMLSTRKQRRSARKRLSGKQSLFPFGDPPGPKD